ncbi:hypothetical protein [Nesterenkonia sp. NBAIMH1]|uniref:hypothetical protein n=1 Tax=Nesterenkonia sp. NBAIMH1 TaxID=2600320 RepID=UPI00143D9CB8|nr:hypothetical protein [Nesterenkonia sp. NBAIMH1]
MARESGVEAQGPCDAAQGGHRPHVIAEKLQLGGNGWVSSSIAATATTPYWVQ